jgi:cytochrome P450
LVTRYDDARQVLADTRFSRNLFHDGAPYQPGDFSTGPRSILNLDPPDHTRVRRLVATAFTARWISPGPTGPTSASGTASTSASARRSPG